jgi:hypothetical protein
MSLIIFFLNLIFFSHLNLVGVTYEGAVSFAVT